MTAMRTKFKKQNMHFSFACLVPDVCLALIAAAAMQVGISHGINLIILLAVERIMISSALLLSTLMEYSFKKTEKNGRKFQFSNIFIFKNEVNMDQLYGFLLLSNLFVHFQHSKVMFYKFCKSGSGSGSTSALRKQLDPDP